MAVLPWSSVGTTLLEYQKRERAVYICTADRQYGINH